MTKINSKHVSSRYCHLWKRHFKAKTLRRWKNVRLAL